MTSDKGNAAAEETAGELYTRLGFDGHAWGDEMAKRFKLSADDLYPWTCSMVMAGYDKGKADATQAGDGWIACSERMPEPGQLVLLYQKFYNETPSIFRFDGDCFTAHTENHYVNGDAWLEPDQIAVPHEQEPYWQPLPKAPGGGK